MKHLHVQTASTYLQTLCVNIPTRAVGSEGNRCATDWFARTIATFGFQTEMPQFQCMDWTASEAWLKTGENNYPVQASPYPPGCDVYEPLVVVSTVAELDSVQMNNKVVLLHGEIAREQLMPKNFPFYKSDEQQHIYQVLEHQQPSAIITATGRNPLIAGGVYPFPMFEDGDFDIPFVFVTDAAGIQLVQHAGEMVHLVSHTERRVATGCNVIALKRRQHEKRIVVMAHIDAKAGTPGALDNGTGVATLLLLAERLADYAGQHIIELVAGNGEDYYANPGEIEFLHRNEGKFNDITLGINLDGIGYVNGKTPYSLYETTPNIAESVHSILSRYSGICEGEPWYQGDHMLFIMNQRPARALTFERVLELLANIIHTEHDTPEQVNPAQLIEVANALHDIIDALNRT